MIAQVNSGRVRVRYLGDERFASNQHNKIPDDPDRLSRFRPRSFRVLLVASISTVGRPPGVHPAPGSIAWPPADRLPDHCLGKVNGSKALVAVHFRRN